MNTYLGIVLDLGGAWFVVVPKGRNELLVGGIKCRFLCVYPPKENRRGIVEELLENKTFAELLIRAANPSLWSQS